MTAGGKSPRLASIVSMASMVAGLLGLLVMPRPLGIVGVLLGIVAVALGKRSGVAGIALGAFDVVIQLLLS
jgi:hypothetical protein